MSIQANFPAIKPTLLLDFANTEALDPRITYSRASTGTYYDGKTVAKAEENLLTFSEQFNNAAWNKSGVTVTSNTIVAPDGTVTGDTLTGTVGGYTQYLQLAAPATAGISAASAVTNTYSIYLKAGTVSSVRFYAFNTTDGANIFGTFNLAAVSAVAGGTAMTPTVSITDVGNGWRRCVITGNLAGSVGQIANAVIYADNGTFYLWGAQVEQRSTVTAYTPTTTQPVTNYIPVLLTAASGVPRFEHNPVTGESLGLEIEEQRTNLLLRSEEFDNAAWTKTNSTVIANAIVAPDGTLTADKLVENTTNAEHRVEEAFSSFLSGTTYTTCIRLKAGERSLARISFSNLGALPGRSVFNLLNGTISSTTHGSASIRNVGNGWYECSVTAACSNSVTAQVEINLMSDVVAISYTGDGFSGIYIWGAQLEAGAFPTSYIPTVASQVTRAADSAVMTGTNFSSWYNQSEGSVLADYAIGYLPSGSMLPRIASINDGSTANCVDLFINAFWPRTAGLVRTNSTSVVDTTIGSNLTATTSEKSIIGYKINDFALTKNGLAAVNDTDGVVPQVVNRLQIGANSESRSVNGTIKKIAYYPRRLTNTQLQALTS